MSSCLRDRWRWRMHWVVRGLVLSYLSSLLTLSIFDLGLTRFDSPPFPLSGVTPKASGIGPENPVTSRNYAVPTENTNHTGAADTPQVPPTAASPDQNQNNSVLFSAVSNLSVQLYSATFRAPSANDLSPFLRTQRSARSTRRARIRIMALQLALVPVLWERISSHRYGGVQLTSERLRRRLYARGWDCCSLASSHIFARSSEMFALPLVLRSTISLKINTRSYKDVYEK
jgi:hypothetical protein